MHELIEEGSSQEIGPEWLVNEFELGEPAEVLVEMAKRGEIDPWDIDIARTTQKFLEYIDSLEKKDLRIPARTLLYASILLRMKSDFVEESKQDQGTSPEIIPDEIEFYEDAVGCLPQPPLRRHTKRPVTLEELISELRKAEMVGRRKALRERWPQSPAEKALDLSHEEGIEDHIKALGPILEDMLVAKKVVSLNDIKGKELIMDYVSLLFMAQRRQVWLEQEEFFGELYIRRHP
jgi:segregation and condensation protein A